MGTAWFRWQDAEYQLLIQQNREERVIKAAAWWVEDKETKDILGGRDEKTGGTWLGCSKQGRVAFLVNVTRRTSLTLAGAEVLTVQFLKGKMTPSEFAKELGRNKNMSSGLTFHLVVADMHSKSMVYISKKSPTKEVDEIKEIVPGFHFITSTGLYDLASPEYKHLKDMYSEVNSGSENRAYLMKKITGKLMNDDRAIVGEGECGTSKAGQKGYYYGTTMLEVKPTGKAWFFEDYFQNGEHKEHNFNFDIKSE
ncbi:unnamed protein product [Thlaspi arvense]|uniref:Uncharacterized protein n=1 Tax=Thlaspi arvense TaxID=13288 RepID=A0AAU9RA46_THLAR|nr:unnamed protein product [Thlaspi arvense]